MFRSGFILREPQHTPVSHTSPNPPNESEFRNINCCLRVWDMLIFRGMLNTSEIYGLQRQLHLRKHFESPGAADSTRAGIAHSLMCAEKRRRDTDVMSKNPRSKTPWWIASRWFVDRGFKHVRTVVGLNEFFKFYVRKLGEVFHFDEYFWNGIWNHHLIVS